MEVPALVALRWPALSRWTSRDSADDPASGSRIDGIEVAGVRRGDAIPTDPEARRRFAVAATGRPDLARRDLDLAVPVDARCRRYARRSPACTSRRCCWRAPLLRADTPERRHGLTAVLASALAVGALARCGYSVRVASDSPEPP
jgi:hypothetical protein